ncbi:MAG TPA: hypothetical protein VJS92_11330 [Candidatus Polarisedimenticolaceae bacterium]|nr:hypothetical protein [Candidatus Polarisedimenticolaceae bacterium]
MMRARVLTVLLLASCSRTPAPPTPGFAGAWERQPNNEVRSILSLWAAADGFHAAWNQFAADGTHLVRCGRRGACAQWSGGQPVFEYSFRVERKPDNALILSCTARPLQKNGTGFGYVDRLELGPTGLELLVYRVENDGRSLEKQEWPTHLVKTSDEPFLE